MTADEILQQIKEQLAEGPDTLDLYQLFSHYYPADARMTVFRSDKQWAIFFEFIGYDCRGQVVWHRLRGYGACLFQREMFGEDVSLILLDENTREPLDGGSSMNEHQFAICWNGQRLELTPSLEDYTSVGIDFDEDCEDPEARRIAQILRYLCRHFDHQFFLSEQELRDVLTQNWGAEQPTQIEPMSLFLQTQHWEHPFTTLEEPSTLEICFPMLARAIASGDLAEWNTQDPSKFNTDWRIYDEAEKAEQQQNKAMQEQQQQAWASLPPEVQDEFRRQGLYGVGFIQIQEVSETDKSEQEAED